MRHHWQDGRGHRDGVSTQNQLHDPVRDHTTPLNYLPASGWRSKKYVSHKQIDLPDPDSEEPWQHQPRYIANSGMREGDAEVEVHALLHQRRYLGQN